ncbi:MAG TPA: carboxyl transferase domain-containing protein [Labilithrix sp.]|nr:carboxyl transferase domain-containing protein [Labilithrix sp.]
MSSPLEELRARRKEQAERDAARARRMGRLSLRERIETLVEPGSFFELFELAMQRSPKLGSVDEFVEGDGLICGWGRVDGRDVMVLAHDSTVRRGSIGQVGADKGCSALERACARGAPVIVLSDSDGARVHEGVHGVASNAQLLGAFARLSGRVPVLWAGLGLVGGAAGYAAALGDLVVGVNRRSFFFITGPQVIHAVTREQATLEDIGGTQVHAATTGLLHAVADDEPAALAWIRRALSYLPNASWELPTAVAAAPPAETSLEGIIPESPRKPYDVRALIARVFDETSFHELSPAYARNLVTGFARLEGAPVGIVASQPSFSGGVLDVRASIKGARFIRLCTAFNLPILTLVDSPGFLPGVAQETGGLLLHGAKLISAYEEASGAVPRINLILRKSCGAASVLSYGGDVVLSLPGAQVQAMGTDALLTVAWGAHLTDLDEEAKKAELAALAEAHDAPVVTAHSGYVQRVVELASVRAELARALSTAPPARPAPRGGRKLSNIPL